jgi:hypothetical protein
MDLQTGRALYKRIMHDARNESAKRGSPNRLLKGTMRDAARKHWEQLKPAQDFEKWWSTVHTLGLRPYSGSTAHDRTADEDKPKKNGATLIDRYRAIVMKYDILPDDAFLADEWGCDNATPGRMRSKLKADGFAFEKRGGVFVVTGRPAEKSHETAESFPAPDLARMILILQMNISRVERKLDQLIAVWQ